jgi:hypothetical protein
VLLPRALVLDHRYRSARLPEHNPDQRELLDEVPVDSFPALSAHDREE